MPPDVRNRKFPHNTERTHREHSRGSNVRSGHRVGRKTDVACGANPLSGQEHLDHRHVRPCRSGHGSAVRLGAVGLRTVQDGSVSR